MGQPLRRVQVEEGKAALHGAKIEQGGDGAVLCSAFPAAILGASPGRHGCSGIFREVSITEMEHGTEINQDFRCSSYVMEIYHDSEIDDTLPHLMRGQ